MGFYVNVHARKGCEQQINDLWKSSFGHWLVYTPEIIRSEIAFIANDPQQEGARWINTVGKWNKAFPILAEGRGQIFLRAFGYNASEAESHKANADQEREKIAWVMSNRMLFDRVTGLQDAVEALGMNIDCDEYAQGRKIYLETPSFDNLPAEPNCKVYDLAVSIDSPELWSRFLAWRNEPNEENWKALRSHAPPAERLEKGLTLKSLWQRVEQLATARDGYDPGLQGRYQGGRVPPETDVMMAITATSSEMNALISRYTAMAATKGRSVSGPSC